MDAQLPFLLCRDDGNWIDFWDCPDGLGSMGVLKKGAGAERR